MPHGHYWNRLHEHDRNGLYGRSIWGSAYLYVYDLSLLLSTRIL